MERPFVFINVAMTADGKIDTMARKGAGISSPRDRERVDRLRAESDAVMVGGRTLLDEDPKLTVKSNSLRAERVARGLAENPMKVGVVSEANIDSHAKFLREGPAKVVIFTTDRTSRDRLEFLRSQGAEVYADHHEKVDLANALMILQNLGVDRLMVEGVATLNFELLRLGLVDEVYAFMAPMIFGGESAPTMAAGAGMERSKAIPLTLINVEQWDDGGLLIKYLVQRSL